MNTKMKVLALALLGLAGYAGSAVASCPTSPVPPWTAAPAFQGAVSIVTGGYDGTACHMGSTINAGASSVAFATVEDDTPSNEPRYRAQFIIDLDAQANPTLNTNGTVFSANTGSSGPALTLGIFGTSNAWFLSYIVTDAGQPSGVTSGSVALATGQNRVEFDLQLGSTTSCSTGAGGGCVAFWVNNTTEGTPTVNYVAINNAAIGGVETAFLGVAGPSGGFVSSYAGSAVGFDQFDSRRQTFIGH